MTREELEHAIRAACDAAGDTEVWVFGSQSIQSGEVSYRADGGTPPRCMAGDGIRPGPKVADGGRSHSVPTLLARDAWIMVGSSSLPTESSNGPVER
jgi:hypothetical protein